MRLLQPEETGDIEAHYKKMVWSVLREKVGDAVRQSDLFPHLPPALRPAYEASRTTDFVRIINMAWALLICLYMGIVCFTAVVYHEALSGPDGHIYWLAEAVTALALLVGLSCAAQPSLQRNFTHWLPLPFGLVLHCKVAICLLLTDSLLVQNQLVMVLLVMAITTLATRLPIWSAAVACGIGASGFLVVPWGHSLQFAAMFFMYYLGGSVVLLFLSWLHEDKSRRVFLQAVLLETRNNEIQELNESLARLANQDGLSGLYNRRHFDESLHKEWERARREGSSLALILIDVDHFKQFNDLYGHPAGDECLRQVGGVLRDFVRRSGDMAARYGGEEFALLLPHTSVEGARGRAQRLIAALDALAIPHAASLTLPHVTISVGVAVGVPSGFGSTNAQHLVDAADTALYAAKRGGRHQQVLTDLTPPAESGLRLGFT